MEFWVSFSLFCGSNDLGGWRDDGNDHRSTSQICGVNLLWNVDWPATSDRWTSLPVDAICL